MNKPHSTTVCSNANRSAPVPSAMHIHNLARPYVDLRGIITPGKRGGPIRTILNMNAGIPSGRYVSRKSRRAMDWEAFHERHLFWISEADAKVVSYLAQPHKLEMFQKGRSRPLVYFPDLMRKLSDGTIEIIETKRTKDEASRDPEYERKLDFAKQIYEGDKGWTYRILTAVDDIEVEPQFSNAKLIKRDAHTRCRTRDTLRLVEALDAAGGSLPYGEAIEALRSQYTDWRRAQAKLHAMIVRRVAYVNIYREITPESPVLKMRDPQIVLPSHHSS
jgi:hypothetical protein